MSLPVTVLARFFATRRPSEGRGNRGYDRETKRSISGLALDKLRQLLCTKASNGSIETIMVTDPGILGHIKVGDNVLITHALALSLKKES